MNKIKLGKITVGEDQPLYFIADIGANHNGDINRAFKLIELAKEAGADAAKFQNFIASKIVSKTGFELLGSGLSHQSKWKKSVYEVYIDASIPNDWTRKLKEKCDNVGLEYFTSAYDFESVDLVDPYVDIHKIGSGDITWLKIIEHIARKGKPIIISTGASTIDEIDKAVNTLLKINKNIVLMQCNTNYTANSENFKYINLNVLKEYKRRYPYVMLGLSDHTHGHATILGAIALGARIFEKHFTDDRSMDGPDHKFSMDPTTWKEMVDRANEVYLALGDGVKKIEENEKQTYIVQRRCLWTIKELRQGDVVTIDDIFPLRPQIEGGILPMDIDKVIGKKVKRSLPKGYPLKWDNIDS